MSTSREVRREIKITWIKNPSHFAFVFLDCEDDARKQAFRLELELNRAVPADRLNQGYTPQLDEVCCFLHKNTWHRVKILLKSGSFTFCCWAMDYGFPFITDTIDLLAPLAKEFQKDSNVIQFGQLSLVPAKTSFDFETCEISSIADTKWMPKAVTIMQNFTKFATKAEFISAGYLNGNWHGDIEFTDANGRIFSLEAKLVEQKLALKIENDAGFKTTNRWAEIDQSDCYESIKFELPGVIAHSTSAINSVASLPSKNVIVHSGHETSKSNTAALLPSKPGTSISKNNFQKIYSAVQPTCSPCSTECSSGTPATKILNRAFLEIIAPKKPLLSNHDVYRIYVHGRHLRDPLEYMKDARFSQEVHDNMCKKNYKTIFKTQSHSWPNILDGRSTIIVNGPKSGKTFSYLPAILSLICKDEESSKTVAQGPAGVIIARSSSEVEKIYTYSVQMLPRQKKEIVKAYGKWNCENKIVQLLNGCDLLITTPPCFARLAAGNVIRVINKNQIKFLVFDDIDAMSSIFEKELEFVIKTCTSGESGAYKNPQIIVTSSTWIEQLRSRYAKLACDPIFIIGSFIECAVYSKCRFSLYKETLSGKLSRLMGILREGQWKKKRTLIMTNSMRDFNTLDDILRSNHIELFKINHRSKDGFETAQKWSREEVGFMKILLMTDEALSMESQNRITSAEVLINYSLPDDWTKFSRRFSTLKDCCAGFIEETSTERPSSIVMLDDENSKEVPALIEFLKNRKIIKEFPEHINKMVKQIVHIREMEKQNPHENVAQICSKVLQFGSCDNPTNCKKRHVLTEADRSVNLPDGVVKFEITSIRNPAHFSIKILEYWPLGERKWISCAAKLDKIEETLSLMQNSLKESHVIHVPVKTNDICAVYCLKTLKWCRCRVLDKQENDDSVFKVSVKLIDSGRKLTVNSNELMKLSRQCISTEPLVCSLRILNIVPYDRDLIWDSETTAEVKKRLGANSKEGSCNIAQVSFAIKDIIFTENIEIQSHLEDVKAVVTEYTLKKDLIKSELCLKDDTVADKLKILLRNANLYVPRSIEAGPKKDEEDEVKVVRPKWKQLTVGCNYNVRLTQFQSPNLFYAVLEDSANLTLRPHMDTIEKFDDAKPLSEISEGMFCLVTDQSQKRQRGVITKKIDQNSVEVFLLDAGRAIECESIYELPPALMEIAPFQAIHCRLMGVKPKFGMKTWEEADRLAWAFSDFIHERCDGKVVKMHTVARKGHVFDVLLFDPTNGRRLDEMAVKELFAHTDETFSYTYVEDQLTKLYDALKSTYFDLNQHGFDQHCEVNEENLQEDKRAVAAIPSPGKQAVPTSLSFIYQQPKIEFRQNDEVVLLEIKATDAVDYALIISDESIKIQVNFESHSERTEVFFYRLVDSSYASHEMIAGSKIIVRLLKKVFGVDWLRLSDGDEPNRFITKIQDPIAEVAGSNYETFEGRPPHCDFDDSSLNSDMLNDDENVPIDELNIL